MKLLICNRFLLVPVTQWFTIAAGISGLTDIMTRKRSSRQATKRQKKKTHLSWTSLFIGLAIGLFITLLLWLNSQKSQTSIPVASNRTAIERPRTPTTSPLDARKNDQELKEKYKFYTELPNAEVIAPVDQYRKKDTVYIQEQKPHFSRGKFSLQAGAFTTRKQAEKRRATLGLQGYESSVKQTKVNGKQLYRVILGPYATLEKTNSIKTRLHARQISTFLVKDD